MKKILTIILAGVSTLAVAQKRAYLNRSIDDDGIRLSVKVSGTLDGREVDVNKTFDVAGLSQAQREALRDWVLSSIAEGNLDLSGPKGSCKEPAAAVLPKPPVPPAPSVEDADAMAFSSNEVNAEIISSGKGFVKEPVSKDAKGFTKHVRYNSETGEMYIKYRYVKDGDEYIFEKTADVTEKSEPERQRVIEKFESEIGLPGNGMEM